MHKILLTLFCVASLAAQAPTAPFSDDAKIAVQNSILANVNGTNISMMDVKKKMDLAFHQNYPQMTESASMRFQFYENSWRHTLMELIDHQLILADAATKEVKLTDGEVREEMERRFGPNIMFTLDQIGLTYDETWKLVREDLLVLRMRWWFIQSKAITQVTPQDIRRAYRLHLQENPAYREWSYRVITIRGEHPEEMALKVIEFLKTCGASPETLVQPLKEIDPSIQVSSEFMAKDQDLAATHREALFSLSPGEYSPLQLHLSRADKKSVARIFYLNQVVDHPTPQFEELSQNLRDELIQKAMAQESSTYLEKLRKHYGFDPTHLKEKIPDDLHPFSLE